MGSSHLQHTVILKCTQIIRLAPKFLLKLFLYDACFSAVLENSGLFSDEYRDKATVLRDKYYPLEMDPTIDREKKEKLMVEWYVSGLYYFLRV